MRARKARRAFGACVCHLANDVALEWHVEGFFSAALGERRSAESTNEQGERSLATRTQQSSMPPKEGGTATAGDTKKKAKKDLQEGKLAAICSFLPNSNSSGGGWSGGV